MAQFFTSAPNASPYANPANSSQNLQFYPSSYIPTPIPGQPSSQPTFGAYGQPVNSAYGYGGNFGASSAVNGRMGEQGGLKTGWLAAFGTEGYEGEPALLEELGVNFEHIRTKVVKNLPLLRPFLFLNVL